MNKRKWSLYSQAPWRVAGILTGNILANIPRGGFHGILFLIIVSLSASALNGSGYDFVRLWGYYWMYAAAAGLFVVLSMAGQSNNFVQSYTISSNLRLNLGEKLRRLSLGFFKSNDPGDVTSRMLHDVNQAEEILSHNLPDLVAAVIVPLLVGGFLFFINPALSSVLVVTVLISMVFFLISRRIITVLGKKHLKAINAASSRILEYTRTIKQLKSYDMTGSSFTSLDEAMLRLKKLSFRTEVWAGIPIQMAMIILDMGYLYMLFCAIGMVPLSLTVPELFAFAILGFYFFEPIKNAGAMLVMLRHAGNSAERIAEIFNSEEPSFSEHQVLPAGNNFDFEDVSFSYGDGSVLRGINCSIPEKSMTALVGVSGSGKTTMTSLIARFWDIREGAIRLDGVDIRNIEPGLLLSGMSMVFQDVFLFNDTIENNIRVGKRDASREEIVWAAKLARCHDFILRKPMGYDTMVSEGGRTLSGGEKQRISIARAIIKDAPVVLLDEATASLDPENEYEIQQALANLVKDKTIIVIAHKFSSIVNARQVLVLDGGRIVESGTHDSLINEEGGLYKRLWQAQQVAGSWKMRRGHADD